MSAAKAKEQGKLPEEATSGDMKTGDPTQEKERVRPPPTPFTLIAYHAAKDADSWGDKKRLGSAEARQKFAALSKGPSPSTPSEMHSPPHVVPSTPSQRPTASIGAVHL